MFEYSCAWVQSDVGAACWHCSGEPSAHCAVGSPALPLGSMWIVSTD